MHGVVYLQLHVPSALDWGERSVWRSCRFIVYANRRGGCVGPTAGLDATNDPVRATDPGAFHRYCDRSLSSPACPSINSSIKTTTALCWNHTHRGKVKYCVCVCVCVCVWEREREREKVPMPLCPSQLSPGLDWNRHRVPALRSLGHCTACSQKHWIHVNYVWSFISYLTANTLPLHYQDKYVNVLLQEARLAER
jgi:hypothetical protein